MDPYLSREIKNKQDVKINQIDDSRGKFIYQSNTIGNTQENISTEVTNKSKNNISYPSLDGINYDNNNYYNTNNI